MITGVTLICSLISGECNLMWESAQAYPTKAMCHEVEASTAQQLNLDYKGEPVVFMYTCLNDEKA